METQRIDQPTKDTPTALATGEKPHYEEVKAPPPAVPKRAADMLIRHEPDGLYRLYAPHSMRVLGTFATRAEAELRAQAMEIDAAAVAIGVPINGRDEGATAYEQRRAGLLPPDASADEAYGQMLEAEKEFEARRAKRLPPDAEADRKVLDARREKIERILAYRATAVTSPVYTPPLGETEAQRVTREAEARRVAAEAEAEAQRVETERVRREREAEIRGRKG